MASQQPVSYAPASTAPPMSTTMAPPQQFMNPNTAPPMNNAMAPPQQYPSNQYQQ
jgi:hypothetical protein